MDYSEDRKKTDTSGAEMGFRGVIRLGQGGGGVEQGGIKTPFLT